MARQHFNNLGETPLGLLEPAPGQRCARNSPAQCHPCFEAAWPLRRLPSPGDALGLWKKHDLWIRRWAMYGLTNGLLICTFVP
jgi:hypothetical protein